MPRSTRVASGKEVDEKWENIEECINRELFSTSRSLFFRQLHTVYPFFCFARFLLLVLAQPATDYSVHTHYYSLSLATIVRWSKRADCQ